VVALQGHGALPVLDGRIGVAELGIRFLVAMGPPADFEAYQAEVQRSNDPNRQIIATQMAAVWRAGRRRQRSRRCGTSMTAFGSPMKRVGPSTWQSDGAVRVYEARPVRLASPGFALVWAAPAVAEALPARYRRSLAPCVDDPER